MADEPEGTPAVPEPHKGSGGSFLQRIGSHKVAILGVVIAAMTLLVGIAAYRRQQNANGSSPVGTTVAGNNASTPGGSGADYQQWQMSAFANQLSTIEQQVQQQIAASHSSGSPSAAPPALPQSTPNANRASDTPPGVPGVDRHDTTTITSLPLPIGPHPRIS